MNKGFKIISDKDFKKIQLLKRPLVFVPMAADLLHHGHIRILNKASKYGTVIVGLMTDKGLAVYKSKPILTYAQREEMMLQIKPIDYIVPLNGLLYTEIAEILKVDYFIHGTDWKKGTQKIVRKKLINKMKNWGGKIIEIPYTKNISSSLIKKRLLEQ